MGGYAAFNDVPKLVEGNFDLIPPWLNNVAGCQLAVRKSIREEHAAAARDY